MEVYVPTNPRKSQDKVPRAESSSLGHHAQSVVEVSHRCTLGFLEKDGEVEQATKAISGSLLGRIRMVNSRKENSGLQGVYIDTLGESSNLEAGPDLSTGSELRFIDMLYLLICCKEDILDILKYLMIWKLDWITSKDLLWRMGWSMVEVATLNPSPIEVPLGKFVKMNILMWNCRGALNPDFTRRIF